MIRALVLVSFALLLMSFWKRNALPGDIDFVPSIAEEPLQRTTDQPPFDVAFNGVGYTVAPEYRYDITGMVVSYRHHTQDNSSMHRRAADHLNMMDLCVVWGDNRHAMLDKLRFWSGLFTCNVSTRDRDAWQTFNMSQLSNNHLLSTDDDVRRRVKDVRIGDQVRIRGYLSSYTSPAGTRGTSTTRTDTGDGACETIFIEDFEIVQAATSYWRVSMYGSLIALIAGLALHFRQPYRPYR
jgi:hypothetical protein